MSRPRHYWYGIVRQMIMRSEELKTDKSLQATIFLNAMRDAEEETLKLPNGDLKMKAVRDVLINKTRTYEGVAQDIHYDCNTVQKWVNKFVNLVGKKAGY